MRGPAKVPRIEIFDDDPHGLQLLPVEMRDTIWDFLPFRAHLHLSVCCTWLSLDVAKRVVVPKGWRFGNLEEFMETRLSLYRCINHARDLGIHLWPGVEQLYTGAVTRASWPIQSFQLRSHIEMGFPRGYGVRVLFTDRAEDQTATVIAPAPSDADHDQMICMREDDYRPIGDALSYLESLALKRTREVAGDAKEKRPCVMTAIQ